MVDPVTVQLLRSRIACLVEEMHHHFYRSGYSTIVRESRDFSCVILDASGGLAVPPPMFFHAPVYRHLTTRIRALYPALAPGDLFVCNHPYEGGLPHVSDMAFAMPVFAEGALVGFAGSIAHKADLGGTNPGSTSASATEIFQEGLLLPPVRIAAAGAADPDLHRLILANSREPELVAGDIAAQIAATRIGADGLAALADRFGAAVLADAFAALRDGAARALAARVAALPDGRAEAAGHMDEDGVARGRPVRFHAAVTVAGDRITVDVSGSDRQARGPVNLRPSMVEACVFYALIGCLGPDLPFNDGMRRAVDIVYGRGTVTNADPPAPVSSYQKANLALVDVILEALGTFNPARAIAGSGSTGSVSIHWLGGGRPGQARLQYEILSSAYGAGPGRDGCANVATHLSNLHITPIEILETEFPCRVARFEPIADGGGAGAFRGGAGFRRVYELLQDAVVTRRYDRAVHPPRGLAGGRPGRASRFVVRWGTTDAFDAPAASRHSLRAGDRFLLETAGGGGYGDPRRRDPAALRRDLAEGRVTPEAAAAEYGLPETAGRDRATARRASAPRPR